MSSTSQLPSVMDLEAKASENDETQQSSSLSDLDSDGDQDSNSNSGNDSGNDSSDADSPDADSPPVQIEWLATARQRRSTAGNRMKSMLANEEPDSDLELLFAEDEDDQGFSDAGDDGSDVHMDSSSDDEDDNNAAANDLDGEKELERQAKERRTAQRKRKAQDAIPAKFRKKVRIDPTAPTAPSVRTAPAPRPKKKSERASWLPTAADLPTRASSRQTTRLSKEQLHQQMVEREAKRLKQLAQMEKKAARLEALKKPPMTQEERLQEAALVEKRNSKSLNRWEEAEKQREEDRRAKLAALNQRKLKGPVLTFWSGMGEWVDGSLKNVGQHMVVEEQPKKKREKVDKAAKGKAKDKEKDASVEADKPSEDKPSEDKPSEGSKEPDGVLVKTEGTDGEQKSAATAAVDAPDQPKAASEAPPDPAPASTPAESKNKEPGDAVAAEEAVRPSEPPSSKDATAPQTTPSPLAPASDSKAKEEQEPAADVPPKPVAPSGLAAPAPPPPTPSPPSPQATGPLTAPLGMSRPQDAKPSGVLAAPVLAPPMGLDVDGASTPSLGYGNGASKSNILALPNISQHAPAPTSISAPKSEQASPSPGADSAPVPTARDTPRDTHLQPILNEASANKPISDTQSDAPPPPGPTGDPTANRNAIVYQSFDENAIRDKGVQTQILFGRKMNKLSKPSPAPICVITNHPARYRDPKTGLPYYNAYAYREIQRLRRGDYRWSKILGTWVGSGTYAARGVPERFLNPNYKPPAAPPADATPAVAAPAPPVDSNLAAKEPKTEPTAGGGTHASEHSKVQLKVEEGTATAAHKVA